MSERHGMCHSYEYGSYAHMIQRCYNPKAEHYEYYGGRGITVSPIFLNSFIDWYNEIGPRPEGYTQDRIRNDGNYEPGNIKWSDRVEQSRNRSDFNVYIEFPGNEIIPAGNYLMAELADLAGINQKLLRTRMKQMRKDELFDWDRILSKWDYKHNRPLRS